MYDMRSAGPWEISSCKTFSNQFLIAWILHKYSYPGESLDVLLLGDERYGLDFGVAEGVSILIGESLVLEGVILEGVFFFGDPFKTSL